MKVQLHFVIDNPADAFDQTAGFVERLGDTHPQEQAGQVTGYKECGGPSLRMAP
jgi:hypothetical protein